MSLHLPYTQAEGVFAGETGRSSPQRSVVLDDGNVVPLDAAVAVDHDARTLRAFTQRSTYAEALQPVAVPLEHTWERLHRRYPSHSYENAQGETVYYSDWTYPLGGEPVNVQERDGGLNGLVYLDDVQHYDGTQSETGVRSDTQTVTCYDFDWEITFRPNVYTGIYRRGIYLGEEEVKRQPQPVQGAGDQVRYRQQQVRVSALSDDNLIRVYTLLQCHIRDIWLSGYLTVEGQSLRQTDRLFEVTHVYEREDTRLNSGYRSRVDAWLTFGFLEEYELGRFRDGDRELVEQRQYATDDQYNFPLTSGSYIRRTAVSEPGEILRDTLLSEWPASPDPPGPRFSAAGGAVRVEGPRTQAPELLEDGQGKANATLTAFGQSFTGGTWAALRDVPLRDDQGRVTSWDTALVLHASARVVTAVRQDGSAATLSRAAFEREILRAPVGSFQGFSPIGVYHNTWVAHWAWALCVGEDSGYESRALVIHDAWRDSYKKDAPRDSPTHWTWKGRPGKRPATLPPTAPGAPLRLTLADVTGTLLHDEPLARAAPPLLLPVTATVGDRDVRRAVAKRVLYPPAQWPEELDDQISTGGPLRLTFAVPSPVPEQIQGAALLLRLKLPPQTDTITVNGEALPLSRLGHNAEAARGWHPYVMPVPATGLYTLTFRGRCSRALLCVHSWTPSKESGNAT